MNWQDQVGKVVRNKQIGAYYRVISYCTLPSVVLKHIDSGEQVTFVDGSIISREFVELIERENG